MAFTGSQTAAELEDWVASKNARSFMLNALEPCAPQDLTVRFPKASPKALNLIGNMLMLNPHQRATINEVVEHNYFQCAPNPAQEMVTDGRIELKEIEGAELQKRLLQTLMYDEIHRFHHDCKGASHRRTLTTTKNEPATRSVKPLESPSATLTSW